MYPILMDPARLNAVLAGSGRALLRRLHGLEAAGVAEIAVFSPDAGAELIAAAGARLVPRLPNADEIGRATLVLVAGLDDETSESLARAARAAGVPVNVEDRPGWCDFHLPAVLRRGDLLLTASTGGRCPGLARRFKQHLAELFGEEWAARLDEIADARARWRADGADFAALARRTQEWIDRKGWFG